jgi:prolyl-tRNA editing enzyme YbaK/EbsC (Cys-tRNA(Pro) deacylase)
MSLESVRLWLAAHAPDLRLIEAHDSTATVLDAARTLGVEPRAHREDAERPRR